MPANKSFTHFPEFLVVLPARMNATRLPGKPLIKIAGVPIIERTYNGVKTLFENVVVATDSDEIIAHCTTKSIPVIKTSASHTNGTTRTLEAYKKLGGEYKYIINVQGDEPFINNEVLAPLCELLLQNEPVAATIKAPVSAEDTGSNVYVVTDQFDRALYFSRAPIPVEHSSSSERYQHVGVYAFQPHALHTYCRLLPTPLEQAESLEQLRWMEHGYGWKVAHASHKPLSIDTPEDLAAAESIFKELSKS